MPKPESSVQHIPDTTRASFGPTVCMLPMLSSLSSPCSPVARRGYKYRRVRNASQTALCKHADDALRFFQSATPHTNSASLKLESHTHSISIPRDLLRKTPSRYPDSRVTDRKHSLSQILRYFERRKDEQHLDRDTTHARLRRGGRRAPKTVCVRCVKTDVVRPFLLLPFSPLFLFGSLTCSLLLKLLFCLVSLFL